MDDLRLGLYDRGLIFMCDFCEIMESSVEVRKIDISLESRERERRVLVKG